MSPPDTVSTLGTLDALPTELLDNILMDLDFQSLAQLRSVNRLARRVVDTLPQYKAIVTHAPMTLRLLFKRRVAASTSCRALHDALSSPACACCGDFGMLLYLFTCIRVCGLCICEERTLRILELPRAEVVFGLDKQALSTLPKVYFPSQAQTPPICGCRRESPGPSRNGSQSRHRTAWVGNRDEKFCCSEIGTKVDSTCRSAVAL